MPNKAPINNIFDDENDYATAPFQNTIIPTDKYKVTVGTVNTSIVANLNSRNITT